MFTVPRMMRTSLVTLLSLGALSGCSFAPDYKRPLLDMPVAWQGASETEALSVQWWKRFNDPVLNNLVTEAFVHNRDIAAAVARVDYARAQLGLSRADQMPLIGGQASATPSYVDSKKSMGVAPYTAGVAASWELDFWGKYRNATAAAQATMLSTEVAHAGMQLSVAAQTSVAYFQLRSLDLQLVTAASTLKTREQALTIYNARYEQGIISELDLTQAKTVVETARTAMYRTRAALDAAEGALSALVGRSPREIMDGTVKRGLALEDIPVPPVIPAGVPSDLLERRPDIRAAEQSLIAANYNIGVAKAAWFPNISLTGMLGVISPQLGELFSNASNTWSYGVNGSVPLLDFGRVKSGVEGAEARQRELLATYEQTVLNAFRDTRDALAKQREASNVVDSLESMVKQLRLAADLARSRYDNGYSSYLEVLDAERSLFQSEMDLATARSDRLASIVNVCLVLGGGWK